MNIIIQPSLIHITELYPTIVEYIFFSSRHRTLTKIDYSWDIQQVLINIKVLDFTTFSDYSVIKLEIKNKKIVGQSLAI